MDLGYGNKNQVIGDLVSKAYLQSSKHQEEALNEEINRYDELLNANDSELEILRERRLQQMKKSQEQRQKWIALGHGTYSSIGEGQQGTDTAKEFFDATKESDRMVIHFHRPSSRICDIFHAHLQKLASKHFETRFVKIDVDPVAQDGATGSGTAYLVEKLGIVVMPTIIIVRNRKVVHHIRGFDELGGVEDFSTEALEYVLGVYDGIRQPEGVDMPDELKQARSKGVNGVNIQSKYTGGTRFGTRSSYDEDDSD
jgi:hypothetical protein